MPENAIAATSVDHVVALSAMGPLLLELTSERIEGVRLAVSRVLENESMADSGGKPTMDDFGKASGYSCPECGGVLWEIADPALLRFRCRVGHSFSTAGLRAEHQRLGEDALWAAIRALEEAASFSRRLAQRCMTQDILPAAEEYERRAARDQGYANEIAKMLMRASANEDQPAE